MDLYVEISILDTRFYYLRDFLIGAIVRSPETALISPFLEGESSKKRS